ncbi:MAG: apolipoprotein N-acyltransferase [Isosphaeraceae bacterium]|nr:apolipoprotein N-acyltransferase [Isosphaeraceae bacterium]
MSLPMLAESGAAAGDDKTVATRTISHPALLGLGSGLALWCTFPPTDWNWLVWVALTPLFLLVTSQRSRAAIYFGSWFGGMAFWLLAISWVRLTDESAWLAWIVMAFVLSLWWPGFVALARLAVLRLKLPLMVAAPILWVGLEYLRAYAFTGFPWYYLAHSQHDVLPVIQIADLTGALGISWLIALVNSCCADFLTMPLLRPTPQGPRPTLAQTRRLVFVALLVTGTLLYGAVRLSTARFRPGPRLALLQSSVPQSIKLQDRAPVIEEVYKGLIAKAMAAESRPDLLVWPETSYPYHPFGTIDAKVDSALFRRLVQEIDPETSPDLWRGRIDQLSRHLHGWTDELKVPMLVGTTLHEFRPSGHAKYNAAVLFEPGKSSIQSYYKIHLVPFGEYVPLISYFPWLTALTPYHGTRVPTLDFGHEPRTIDLGPYRIATAICFEDSVPHVVREFFAHPKDGRQPDLLVNISNDGWFHGSAEHDMHLAVSAFRAVENRVPIARAVNTGISAFINGNGRVVRSLAKSTDKVPVAGVLADFVELDDRSSVYSQWGDWVGFGCLCVSIGLLPLAYLRGRSQPLAV